MARAHGGPFGLEAYAGARYNPPVKPSSRLGIHQKGPFMRTLSSPVPGGTRDRAPGPFERAAWWWPDLIASHSRAVAVLLCLAPGALLYGMTGLGAARAGSLEALGDGIVLAGSAGLIVGAAALARLPGRTASVAAGLRPWLANGDEMELQPALSSRRLLRFFWPGVVFGFLLQAPHLFTGSPLQAYGLDNRWAQLLFALLFGYFVGGAIGIVAPGLTLYVRSIERNVRLRRDFLFKGGKSGLLPLNGLILSAWLTFTAPFFVLGTLATARRGQVNGVSPWEIVSELVIIGVTLTTVILPHLFINRLLRDQKSRELSEVRTALEDAAIPEPAEQPVQAVQRLIRHQHLVERLHETQAISASMIDTKSLWEIGWGVAGMVLVKEGLAVALVRVFGG